MLIVTDTDRKIKFLQSETANNTLLLFKTRIPLRNRLVLEATRHHSKQI